MDMQVDMVKQTVQAAPHVAPVVKHVVHHAAPAIAHGVSHTMEYVIGIIAGLLGAVAGWFAKTYFGTASADVNSLLKQVQSVLPTTSTPATATTPAQIHVSVPASTPVVAPAA